MGRGGAKVKEQGAKRRSKIKIEKNYKSVSMFSGRF